MDGVQDGSPADGVLVCDLKSDAGCRQYEPTAAELRHYANRTGPPDAMPPIGRRTDGVLALARFGGCAMPGRMLLLSFSVLVAAALLGSCLAALHLPTGKAMLPGWPLGLLHGLLGAAGLVMLLLALRGPPRGEAMGVGPFGRIAAVLLAMALLAGLATLAVRLRYGRVPGLAIGIHATIAISGVVILAAYTLVG
jgi:hypothetical protein